MPASRRPRAAPVLLVVEGLGLSGKTKALVDLACRLDPARYAAAVCCFDREGSPLADRLAAHGVPLYEVACRDGLDPGAVGQLARVVRAVRPAVVHCVNPRPMLYAGAAARLAGVRGVVGSLSAFACQVPDREYSFLPLPLHTTGWRSRLRNRLTASLVRAVVTVSRGLGERFCRANGVPRRKLRVIPYGVDVDATARHPAEEVARFRAEVGAGPGAVLFGSIGRVVEQKDHATQLRAFAAVCRRVPAARMVVAGDGPLRPDLGRLAAELGVADRVRLLGHTDRVGLVLRSLDVFVMASIFEPFGVALLEALAAGVAVVATRVNEIPEIVADGETGLLVPPSSPDKLADALVRLADDPGLRDRLAGRAAADARRRFSLAATVDQYQLLYDEVRGRAAGPPPAGSPAPNPRREGELCRPSAG